MHRIHKLQINIPINTPKESKVGRQRWNIGIIHIIYTYSQEVFLSITQVRSNIHTKACITTFMSAQILTIQIHLHFLVSPFKIYHSSTSFLALIYKQTLAIPSWSAIKSSLIIIRILGIPSMRNMNGLPRRIITARKMGFKRRTFRESPSIVDCIYHTLLRMQAYRDQKHGKKRENFLHH